MPQLEHEKTISLQQKMIRLAGIGLITASSGCIDFRKSQPVVKTIEPASAPTAIVSADFQIKQGVRNPNQIDDDYRNMVVWESPAKIRERIKGMENADPKFGLPFSSGFPIVVENREMQKKDAATGETLVDRYLGMRVIPGAQLVAPMDGELIERPSQNNYRVFRLVLGPSYSYDLDFYIAGKIKMDLTGDLTKSSTKIEIGKSILTIEHPEEIVGLDMAEQDDQVVITAFRHTQRGDRLYVPDTKTGNLVSSNISRRSLLMMSGQWVAIQRSA